MTPAADPSCEWRSWCKAPVSHIDEKGYVYCAEHGAIRRRYGIRCRALSPAELATIRSGKPIERYEADRAS